MSSIGVCAGLTVMRRILFYAGEVFVMRRKVMSMEALYFLFFCTDPVLQGGTQLHSTYYWCNPTASNRDHYVIPNQPQNPGYPGAM